MARVMTLEEVKASDFVHLEFQGVIWEDCAVFIGRGEIHLVNEDYTANWWLTEKSYGDSWRCWTDVPTREQQEEAWAK